MSEKVKEFLDSKKTAEKIAFEETKKKTLIELGLYEKVYSPTNEYSPEFCFSDWDSANSMNVYYKKVPVDVTNEEYEEIKKYSNAKPSDNARNPIANIFKVIAYIVYIGGFIASFILGRDGWGDLTAMVLVWWIAFFISGTAYLGFAEILQLLTDIKNK